MKALVILFMPALMLIGCGQLETNKDTAANTLNGLNVSEQDLASNENLLNEPVEISAMSSNSFLLKLGGAELLVDFVEDLKGDTPEEIAMIINGVDVAQSIVADPQSLQGLIASLVASQIEDIDVTGTPAGDLVKLGLGLITGDTKKGDFSNLFGTIVRGFFSNFLSGSPIGAILGQLGGSISGNGDATDATQPGTNNSNNNNQDGGIAGGIVDAVIGSVASSNPLFGGILSLISNLIK